jgi:hypothetical protein
LGGRQDWYGSSGEEENLMMLPGIELTELLHLLLNMVNVIIDWLLTAWNNFHVIYELKFVL